MRCQDVTRELAAPRSGLDPAALAAHLAACPACSAWAASADRLDSAWKATRPEALPGAFDAVWANVCQTLDAPTAGRTRRPALIAPWRREVVRVAGVVSIAAALLVAGLVLLQVAGGKHHGGQVAVVQNEPNFSPQRGLAPKVAAREPVRVDVQPMRPVLIRLEGQEVQVVSLTERGAGTPNMVAAAFDDFDMFNTLEALAQ